MRHIAELLQYRYRFQQALRQRRYRAHVRRSMTVDVDLFRTGVLPRGYGLGLSERAVEFGWAMCHGAGGRMLDAGSTFNHDYTLDALLPQTTSVDIFTFVPEAENFPERGVTYAYGDLRAMPYPDSTFDCVACLSVLEHVGMDNSGYGASDQRSLRPNEDVALAVAEMRRVLRPAGRLLITVPYGRAHDHRWLRVFGPEDIACLISAAGDSAATVTVYAAGSDGWQLSSIEAAAESRYGAWQATAVACICATCVSPEG